jgi:hypothetical protein
MRMFCLHKLNKEVVQKLHHLLGKIREIRQNETSVKKSDTRNIIWPLLGERPLIGERALHGDGLARTLINQKHLSMPIERVRRRSHYKNTRVRFQRGEFCTSCGHQRLINLCVNSLHYTTAQT